MISVDGIMLRYVFVEDGPRQIPGQLCRCDGCTFHTSGGLRLQGSSATGLPAFLPLCSAHREIARAACAARRMMS